MASIISELGNLVGGNLADGISKIISLFKVDPNVALQHQVELAKIQADIQSKILDGIQAQTAVNEKEAASSSVFVAGWRPWIGWVCGAAFAYAFVFQPFFTFMLAATHSPIDPKTLPTVDLSNLLPVLLGMLGLAGMRSYEKVQGVPNTHKTD